MNDPNWTEITEYLAELSKSVGATTYRSHKTVLVAYERWCASKDVSPKEGKSAQVARFLESRYLNRDYSLETAYGHLCTLSNFHAVVKRADPELEKIRIVTHIDVSSSPSGKALRQRICDQFSAATSPSGTSAKAVKELVAHLRERHYGCRTHVVTEVLLDTKGRIEPTRNLNIDDLDQERGTVEITVPDQFLVADLLATRTANLSKNTLDAIKTYLRYERKETHDSNPDPLFTTREGRVGASTLRKAVQRESKSVLPPQSVALEYPGPADQNDRTAAQRNVSLSDIRWAAIKSWLEYK
ncbi:tyrosine-type recombinase/integrase [Natrarchaeobius oligotrophus]|uniref:Site-specific integrase n=1 Tax=Natrarchaeobius chitinivorans TaxID=1679083 RepID=A0A3N6MD85_NATCH|nr:tyrosine-type recombinase/integrase [Natrarchaeobius chitinivorans]RQH01819.1 site-specific integrase [Natrarchaeobius chitinivorans]